MRSWGTDPAPPTDGHAEREYERNQGKESLRRTPLPQTENEYDTLYQSSEYVGSNVARPQVANQSRDQVFDNSLSSSGGGAGRAEQGVGHIRGGGGGATTAGAYSGQGFDQRFELQNLAGNHNGAATGTQSMAPGDTPFVSSLNKMQYTR